MDQPHQLKVLLSVDICCLTCENKWRKKILKIAGVRRVHTYVDENLISVIGRMDTGTLLETVQKVGKKPVKLLSSEVYVEKDGNSNTRMGGGHSGCGHGGNNGCGHGGNNGCGHGGGQHEHIKEEEEHKCETYVLPTIDNRICRSYYCRDHPKLRGLLDRVPEESSTFFGGGLHSGCGGLCGGYPCEPYGYPPQRHANMPMYPNMTQFGPRQPPRMRPFGFM